jgi:hypothetical protein
VFLYKWIVIGSTVGKSRLSLDTVMIVAIACSSESISCGLEGRKTGAFEMVIILGSSGTSQPKMSRMAKIKTRARILIVRRAVTRR